MSIKEKAKDIFEEIKEENEEWKRKRTQKRKLNAHRKSNRKEKKERIRKLRKEAEEYKALFQNDKYKHFKEFLDNLEKSLHDALHQISRGRSIDEVGLKAVRLTAKLELLDNIRNYPEKVVKKAKEIEK